MNIKRFFAADMRRAIAQIRDEQGPDAVILSSHKVEGGIEVISAIDFDENLMAGMATSNDETREDDKETGKRVEMHSQLSAMTYDKPNKPITYAPLKPNIADAPEAVISPTLLKYCAERDIVVPKKRKVSRSKTVKSVNSSRRKATELTVRKVPQSVPAIDPSIGKMQIELKNLRGLLQDQMSQLVWGDFCRKQPYRAQLVQRLNRLGLTDDLSKQLSEIIGQATSIDSAWLKALKILTQNIECYPNDLLNKGGVIALVGATGVGKTTTIAKIASRFALTHGRDEIALITTDTHRIGGQKQLSTFAQILGIPVHLASSTQDLDEQVRRLSDRRLILIDTAGFSQRDKRLKLQLATLKISRKLIRLLVVPAQNQAGVYDELMQAFGSSAPDACVFTKLDETVNLGGALSMLLRYQTPLIWVCDGQRIPEDLHPANAAKLVSCAVKLAKREELRSQRFVPTPKIRATQRSIAV